MLSCTAPSAQWKSPYGQIDGWWLPWARPTSPATVYRVPWKACTPTIAASSDVRTTCPRPVRDRSCSAATHPVRAVHTGEQVADGDADTLRVVRSRAGQRHQAALALGDLVVPRPAALGAVVAEPADREDHEPWIERVQPLDGKAEPVEHAGPEVLQQDVRPRHELFEQGTPVVGLEVGGHRLLVPVARQEIGADRPVRGVDEGRSPAAGVVAAVGRLDLHDTGAEVTEHHRGVRPGERPGEVDDEGAGQRSGRAVGHGGKARPRRPRDWGWRVAALSPRSRQSARRRRPSRRRPSWVRATSPSDRRRACRRSARATSASTASTWAARAAAGPG